ncbi:hypothetical protein NZL82_19665 [Sphingomonas sanguinis]|uniref:hypothetical protein n=1 Tax=Sphingomonas sp. LC-1 TaxID=3110957 RepID=UPI0021BB4559|nr:hypothetical protein [Sphingomonas sp. LC-1]MCT8004078.1 hypothetical protein [Sphingomonas sp. LC-1]
MFNLNERLEVRGPLRSWNVGNWVIRGGGEGDRYRPNPAVLILALRSDTDHPSLMSDPANNSDYLISRFFVGLLALAAVVIAGVMGWEISSGVVHHRTGGMAARADDPGGFWIDLAIQGTLAVFLGWQAYRMRRFARRN